MAQIEGGANFGELAKKHSEDEGSKVKDGDLGQFTRGQMVLPFEEALLKLKKGEVSAPVKTQFGWHIIKRGETTPGSTRELKEVKPLIEGNLKQEKQKEVFEDWLKKQKEQADIQINEALLKVDEPVKAEKEATPEGDMPEDQTAPPAEAPPAEAPADDSKK